MKTLLQISFLATCFLYFPTAFGQTLPAPNPQSTPPTQDDNNVVKISTNLIQLDVIVTDKKGRQVTDLKSEDFEIFENGEKQDVTNFSYIFSNNSNQPSGLSAVKSTRRNTDPLSAPPPPSKLKLEQVRRTYAIVVDDLGLSFENVPAVQDTLKKFVNEQIQDGDLVAILRTGSGIGALQSFTNDKRQLLAAINKLRWNPQGRGGISSFGAIETSFKDELKGTLKASGDTSNPAGNEEDKEFQNQIDQFRSDNFAVGTLGALNYILRGMKELPGRKSVVLFSEGFPLLVKETRGAIKNTQALDYLKVLADAANRASVVFYTIDPRGLIFPGMAMAADDVGIDRDDFFEREADLNDTQQSLRYLAYETGGLTFINQNNLNLGLQRAINDQSGYYLIGYQPDSDTFDKTKSKFNRFSVKLKRPGLTVRYRSGFFGITDKVMAKVKQTPQQQVYSALTSPFGANGITLNVSTLFADNEKGGSFIRSFVNINANDLNFSQEADGTHKANFDLVAMTFGDNGAPVDEATKNYTIRLGEKAYQKALQKGFVYNLLIPIKKPGAYQFRIALRDSASAKVGAASQFVEVPNLKKGHLTLSGVVLDSFTPVEWQKISSGQKLNGQNADETNADANTSLRSFKRGEVLRYDYLIYNAKTNPSQLQVQARLFRDGKLLVEGKPSNLDVTSQTDLKRLQAVGAITLGKNLVPGNYVLQVIAVDGLTKVKRQLATRWIDFEITE